MIKKISENVLLSITYALVGLLAIESFFFYKTTNDKYDLENQLSQKSAELNQAEQQIAALNGEKNGLSNDLEAERNRVNDLANQFEDVKDSANKLEKLSNLDKELLQKYSKVYFLNENYTPKNLVDVPEEYLATPKITTILREVEPFLEKMIKAAKRKNIDLRVVSAYRSFDEQVNLKSSYKVIYGTGANQFSADQGYSEHQLGTTVDFSSQTLGTTLSTTFENDPGFKWLSENAYKYGFILSYPKGNAYYQYEPWHWRFVGVDLATDLHDDEKSFYGLDQREIDKYLIKIFD